MKETIQDILTRRSCKKYKPDMISDEVIPVPKGSYPPVIEGSDDLLRELCWDRAKKMYEFKGEIPEIVTKRLNKELDSIINNGFSIMYISAQNLLRIVRLTAIW